MFNKVRTLTTLVVVLMLFSSALVAINVANIQHAGISNAQRPISVANPNNPTSQDIKMSSSPSGTSVLNYISISRYPLTPSSNQSVFLKINASPGIYPSLNISVSMEVTRVGPSSTIHTYFNFSDSYLLLEYLPVVGAYVSYLPALPNFCIHGLLGATYYVNSSVAYYALNYNVTAGAFQRISGVYHYNVSGDNTSSPKSMVMAFSQSALNNTLSGSNFMEYYYGLSNPGMTSNPNASNTEYIMIISTGSVSNSSSRLQYSVSSGTWQNLSVKNTTFGIETSYLDTLANLNLSQIVSVLSSDGINVPLESLLPIYLFKATIPPVSLGNYVMYRGISEINGKQINSSEGMYYITNGSGKRVFLVDPHPFTWLLSRDALALLNDTTQMAQSFGGISSPLVVLSNVTSVARNANLTAFENLQSIAEKYNIYVGWPDNVTYQEIGNFSPSVITLDNLYLGYQSGPSILNWDIGNISAGNTTLQRFIINFVQTNTHTGLIVSSGTISDLQYWQSPSSVTPIFSVDTVGSSLSDANVLQPDVLSSFMGMPMLPVIQYVKDLLANSLYSASPQVAEALGSAPFLLPDMPWNGTLDITDKSVFGNLPSSLNLKYENPYASYGWNATSSVGWQLAMPDLLFEKMIFHIEDSNALNAFAVEGHGVSSLLSQLGFRGSGLNLTGIQNLSIKNYLQAFLESLLDFNLSNGVATLKILNNTFSMRLPSQLLGQLPLKVLAMSPNMEGGILGYNRTFGPNGYRSAYVSFNLFNDNSTSIPTIFSDLVSWTTNWTSYNSYEYGGIFLNKSEYSSVNHLVAAAGHVVNSSEMFVSTNGYSNLSILLNAGNYTLTYISPYSSLILRHNGTLMRLEEGAGQENFTMKTAGYYNISISSDATLQVSPVEVIMENSTLYTVTFTESGLPSGTTWYVNLSNGVDSGAITGTSYSFSLTNGTYSYAVGNVSGYTISASSGSISVNGNGVSKTITFSPIKKSPPSSGISSTELYGIIGGVVAVAAFGSVLAIMRKKR